MCLINIGNGVPIISSLEFRPLLNITYQTASRSLSLQSRFDFGPSDSQEYRYPSTFFVETKFTTKSEILTYIALFMCLLKDSLSMFTIAFGRQLTTTGKNQ